jgi:exodeoxyribonuclease VII small subunit
VSTKKKTGEPDHLDNFESILQTLEDLVEKMEHGELTLEESLAAFEQGVKLTRGAQKALAEAEQKVQLLLEENGELVTRDFQEPGDTE